MGSLIAGVLCLVGALAAPQEGVAEQGRLLERRLDFERAWQGADEAARDRVRADVDLRRRRGPGALQYTDAGQFVRWSQLLRAGSTPPVPLELQSWIGELELAFVPGCMTLAEASQPTQIVAHVTAAGGPPLPQEAGTRIRVGLDWIHPGGERLAGRREFVDLRAFRLQGFDMFLTLPAAQEGIWYVQPFVEVEQGLLYGHRFPFFALEDNHEFPSDLPEAREQALQALRTAGQPAPEFGPMGALLSGATMPGSTRTVAGQADPAWFPAGERTPGRIFVLQDSSPLPGWEFVGPRGEAWYALTQAGDAVVVHRGPWDPSAPGSIWAAVSELRGALPSVPVWVVVRGDELRALWAGARPQPTQRPTGLVIVAARRGGEAPASPVPDLPALWILPSDPGPEPAPEPTRRCVSSADPFAVVCARLGDVLRGLRVDWKALERAD